MIRLSNFARLAMAALSLLCGFGAAPSFAATYTWDVDGTYSNGPTDGTGNWSTSATWYGSTTPDVAWNNLSTSMAQFGSGTGSSTAYTVTLQQSTSANGLIFQNQAYTLTGSTLNLIGTSPFITVNATGGTIGSYIAGSSGLTMNGLGNLTITGTGMYTGGTTVSAGAITAFGNQQIPAGTITVNSGAAIDYVMANEINRTLTGLNFSLAGAGSSGQGALVANVSSGTANADIQVGNVSLSANAAIGAFGGQGTTSNSGIHFDENGGASGVLTLNGHTLTFVGSTTAQSEVFSGWLASAGNGNIVVNSGNLELNGAQSWTGGSITVNSGAVLAGYNGSANTPLALNGGTLSAAYGTFTLSGSVSLSGTAALTNSYMGGNYTGTGVSISGNISGPGALANLAGTSILSGSNSYSGGTQVSGGLLEFTSSSAVPAGAGGIALNNGGGLVLAGAYSTATAWLGSGLIATSSSGALALAGSSNEAITMGSYSNLSLGASGSQTYSGVLTPAGTTYRLGGGGGTLTYTPLFSATSGLAISGPGSVVFPNPLGGGNYSLPILDNGTLTLTTNANQTFAGAVSGSGGLNLNGGGVTTLAAANSYSGATSVSGGTLNLSGSAASSGNGSLVVGNVANGVLNITTTGTLTFNSTNLGNGSNAGVINQSAGLFNAEGDGGYVALGNANTGYGAINLSGGTMSAINSSGFRVGSSGIGVFTQTGGSLSSSRYFVVGGNQGSVDVGSATFLGGAATFGSSYYVIIGNASGATGVVNLGTESGGTATLTALDPSNTVLVGQASGANATLNLNSGTLNLAGAIATVSGGTGTVNFNGGTLQPTATGLTLVNNTPTKVNIFNGGANFNIPLGESSTVSANLLATTGSGIYLPLSGGSVTVASGSGGTGYIGAPYVSVLGGSGTGATAVADVAGGVITGVTLTSPGQGYLANDVLTFSFSGGGAAAPVTSYQYTLQSGDIVANGAGGLTKVGAGQLILTGTNTYTGITSVSAGTLTLSGGLIGNSSAINVAAGALLTAATSNNSLAYYNPGTTWFVSGAISQPGSAAQTLPSGGVTLSGGTLTSPANSGNASYGNFYDTTSATLSAIGAGNAISSTNFGIASGATLTLNTPNPTDSLTASNAFILSGGLTKIGSGTVTLSGTSTYSGMTTVNGGALTYSGGASSSGGGTLLVGSASNSVVNLNSSGTVAFYTTANIGTGAGVAGVVNQSAGTFNAMNSSGYLEIGYGTNAYGCYNLTGGTLNTISASGLLIGNTGIGVFNQSGGQLSTTRYFEPGAGSGGNGVATFTGGSASLSSTYRMQIGNTSSAGILNIGTQTGGSAVVGVPQIELDPGSGLNSSLNLNSGTLSITGNGNGTSGVGIYALGGTTAVNFNGGVLNVSGNTLTVISSTPSSVNVYNGGAIFNMAASSGTISASLLATAGSGIYLPLTGGSVTVASGSGGSGYLGAPYVSVIGGSGSGASAVADLSGGAISGVTLTNPGQGYMPGDVLTFSFSGGGATIPAATYQYTLQSGDIVANGAGGLTKSGSGQLTLTGADTYTGNTNVSAGTLVLNAGSFNNGILHGTANVSAGAVLQILGNNATASIFPTKSTDTINVAGGGTLLVSGGSVQAGSSYLGLVSLNSSNGTAASVITTDGSFFRFGDYASGTLSSVGPVANTVSTGLVLVNANSTSATVTTGPGNTLNFTGPIVDYAGYTGLPVNYTGSGTVVLTGSNTYVGPTNINGGTLQIGNGGSLSPNSSISDNGTLAFSMSNTVTQGTQFTFSAIAGTGGLLQQGSGALVILGTNAYTGQTTISSGTLQFGNGSTAGALSPSSSISNGGTLVFNSPGTLTQGIGFSSSPISGVGGLVQAAPSTLALGSNSYTGPTTISAGTLSLSGSLATNSVSLANGSTLNLVGGSFGGPLAANGGYLTGSGTVGGLLTSSGNIFTIASGGTLSANSGFYVSSGSMYVNGTIASSGTGGTVNSGATLGGQGTAGAVVANAGGIIEAGQGGAGTLTLSSLSFTTGILNETPGQTLLDVTGSNGLSATSVSINLAGSPLLSGSYSLIEYLGNIQNSGTSGFHLGTYNSGARGIYSLLAVPGNGSAPSYLDLVVQTDSPVWSGSVSNEWDTNTTQNWKLLSNGSPTVFKPLDLVIFSDTAARTIVDISSGNVQPSTVTFNNNVLSYTLTGSNGIAGGTVLTKNGTALLTIANVNSYTGGTNLNAGTIALGTNNGLPSGGALTLGSSGSSATFNLAGYSQQIGALSIGSGAAAAGQAITASSGNSTLTYSASGVYSAFGGAIRDTASTTGGTLGLQVSAGTLDLTSGSPIYSGTTAINGSGLLLATNLPNTSAMFVGSSGALTLTGANLNITAGISDSGTVSFTASSGTTTLASLSGGGTANFNSPVVSIANLGSGIVNLANSAALTLSAGTQATGSINGQGANVTMAGQGALSLWGANSYSGSTTVLSGTLDLGLTGTLLQTSSLSIAAGAQVNAGLNNALAYAGTAHSWNVNGIINVTNSAALTLPYGGLNLSGGTLTSTANGGNATYGNFYAGTSSTITASGASNSIQSTNFGMGSGATLTLNTPQAADALTISAALGGTTRGAAGGLTKVGLGSVTFTGVNSYTGATNVNGGILTYMGSASSGPSNLVVGGTLSAVLNLNTSGTVAVNGDSVIGGLLNTSGAVNQTSGMLAYNNSGGNYFYVGGSLTTTGTGCYGSYSISGGTLANATASTGIEVGEVPSGATLSGNIGVFTQTGGFVGDTRGFYIGNGVGSQGVVTFTGGSATLGSGFGTNIGATSGVGGSFNLGTESGGSSIATIPTAGFTFEGNASLNATLNLNSGTLALGGSGITKNATAGTGVVNFNGGTVQAASAGLTLVDYTPTSVNIFNGGAFFNTSGYTATVSANLLATTGDGLYPSGGSLTVTSGSGGNGGSGYIGAPIVGITGGSGYGATAIADISGGVITGVTITSPGQNYQPGDVLTFSFSGGGAASPAGAYQYTVQPSDVAANGAGGVTKTGSGMLILSGQASTYSGGTRVTAGTLQLGSVNALAAGGLTANNGVVDLASYSPTVASLSGSAGVITNNSFEPAILSVNPSVPTATTFSGAFYDGAASVGLTVGGGTLTLLGNNTHSGPTTINGGSLIAGAANSLSPNSFVTVNGGVLDVQAAPQTIGGLSLGSGGVLNLNTSSLLTANALSTLGGTINVFGSTSGTAELISFTGSASGTFTAGTIMPAGYTIGFNSTDTQLDLLKMSTGPATWNVSTSGSWNTGGNWTTNPTVPSGVGVTAVLGSATNLPTTISLDSPQTLGTLTFANSAGYTLAPGTSGNGSLTLDNTGGTNGGQIIVLAGTHSITAPLVISNSAAYVALVNSGSLDISGDIGQTGGSHSLSLSSSDATGVLSLDGTNTFTGGVYVNSGTLVLNGASALLPGSALVIGTTVPASLPSVLSSPVAAPSVNLAPVPEPGTLTLFTVCVVAMGMGLRRRKLAELARRLCRSIV